MGNDPVTATSFWVTFEGMGRVCVPVLAPNTDPDTAFVPGEHERDSS
jgi:hypothetical protein